MTEEQLKTWLLNLETLKAQVQAWNKCLDYKNDNLDIQQKIKIQLLQIEILTKGLQILSEDEKFVIQMHLVSKLTWNKVWKLYEDKWGIQNGRSIRTLKRMQRRGLQKMLGFIIESKVEGYFR